MQTSSKRWWWALAAAVAGAVGMTVGFEGERAGDDDARVPATTLAAKRRAAVRGSGKPARLADGERKDADRVVVRIDQAARARTEARSDLLARRERAREENDAEPTEFLQGLWDPTPEQLQDMARRCEVRWSYPDPKASGPSVRLPKGAIDSQGLSAAEVQRANAIVAELNDGIVDVVRKLYVETTGDAEGAATLSYNAMENEIVDKAVEGDVELAQQQVARERAGLGARREPATALVRLLRAHVARTAEYHRRMLAAFGPTRGRAIRDSLPSATYWTEGCPTD